MVGTESEKSINQTEYNEMWEVVCRLLNQSIPPMQVSTWIQPLQIKGIEQVENRYKVFLVANNDFSADWVRQHHKAKIQEVFGQVAGLECDVYVETQQDDGIGPRIVGSAPTENDGELAFSSPSQTIEESFSAQSYQQDPPPNPRGAVLRAGGRISAGRDNGSSLGQGSSSDDALLDRRYTFENFVVGASNQFAFASAVAVAEQPAKQYNPLFLYSPPGLGKTHLLHAIGNYILTQFKTPKVAYLSAEKFVNELIESLQRQKMPDFRAKYRDRYNVILIDDIQFLAGKSASEEEFFHTFNALHSTRRQIIVSSDRPPKEIQGLAERIRTRFEWGLVADIKPPEIETRIAILRTKADRDDIYLPEDVATFLASHVKTNVRELEGVLIKLQAQASLSGAEISLEMAKKELQGFVPEEDDQVTVDSIQTAVARHFHIRMPELKSTSRAKAVALPRQIAMFLIRKYTGMGFHQIGQHFGGKDHSTIVHACQKVEKGVEADTELRTIVESIQNLL